MLEERGPTGERQRAEAGGGPLLAQDRNGHGGDPIHITACGKRKRTVIHPKAPSHRDAIPRLADTITRRRCHDNGGHLWF
ncbi:hypothetical protein [Actinomadura roseirufa]|uniref:hypothetical protein n=1 Tax=Actinomadura roseirufa TaxID=2094049 RepID=UPI0010417AA7|nr:hypothetical protein [Actinomadura roseirufa]